MERIRIFETKGLYRDDFRIDGFTFGEGEKTLAIVGSMRGNEGQQLYTCSMLVKRMKELEEAGRLVKDKQILIIPSVNPYSMNIRKRFWTIDNTDINRMFPGYDLGETTQRIAAGVFNAVKDFRFGIQFASFYMRGNFVPHVRMMKTGFEDTEHAKEFGIPYIMIRNPRPFDTTTLNYNWQIWDCSAFSLYTTDTESVNRKSSAEAVKAIERFMIAEGILIKDHEETEEEPVSHVMISDSDLITVRSKHAGFIEIFARAGTYIDAGEKLAVITDTLTAEVLEEICAPSSGMIIFSHNDDLAYANTALFKIASAQSKAL